MTDQEVERILQGHLARKLDGAAESADELCAAHPEHAEVLRRRLSLLGELDSKGPIADSSERELPRAFDGYEVVRELGRGGMGVVFEARQLRLERRVAIKLLTGGQGLSSRLRERFEREIAMLARIRHPNVVKVFGSGVVQDSPYVVMELVEGDSLALRPGAGAPARPVRAWRDAVKIGAKMARALDHLHELGVVHRDVKPSNVLVDARGEPVLIDFGLAREADSDALTRSGEFVGTLAYTAPEQARGERVDRRADVYGLGATLFHLVTGAPPYRAASIADLVRQIDAGPPSSARRVNRDVPRDLATVLEHALALQPLERYASCADFAEDLEALLDGRPIRVQRRSLASRALAWARRRPTAAALVCALGALSVVSMALGLRWRADAAIAREQRRRDDRLELLSCFVDGGGIDRDGRTQRLAQLSRRNADDPTFVWLEQLATLGPLRPPGKLSAAVWSPKGVARMRTLYEREREWLAAEPTGEVLRTALEALEPRAGGALRAPFDGIDLEHADAGAALRCALTLRGLAPPSAAARVARRALELSPEDPLAAYIAAATLREHSPLEAITAASDAFRRVPHPAIAIEWALAELEASRCGDKYDLDKLARTWELVAFATDRAPDSPMILQIAGYVYHEAKPPDWHAKAEEFYRRAIAVGDLSQARFSLHNLRWQLGLREPDSVLELLAPIEESYGHYGIYWQNLAWAHEKQRDVERAVELLERGVELCDPEWRSEQLDWLIYMRGRMPGGADRTALERDFDRLLEWTTQDTQGLERLTDAARVVSARRDCVVELLIERQRAGVPLGKSASSIVDDKGSRR
jgi:tetratricopeptide (TPR) repeat protein/predicted Ser/Thr protein kinase